MPVVDSRKTVDAELVSLAYEVLDALEDFAAKLPRDASDLNNLLPQECAYHYALLLHGITKAATELAKSMCGWQLFALRRLAFEYYISGQYYARFPRQACAYVASVPIIQKRLSQKWMKYNKRIDYSKHIAEYDAQIRMLREKVPEVAALIDDDGSEESEPRANCRLCRQRIAKKRRKTQRVELVGLAIELFKAELNEHPEFEKLVRETYGLDFSLTSAQVAEIFAREQYLKNAEYPSQQIHGTALSMAPTLKEIDRKTFGRFSNVFDDPTPLLWGCVGFCNTVFLTLGKVFGVDAKPIFEALKAKHDRIGERLGIG